MDLQSVLLSYFVHYGQVCMRIHISWDFLLNGKETDTRPEDLPREYFLCYSLKLNLVFLHYKYKHKNIKIFQRPHPLTLNIAKNKQVFFPKASKYDWYLCRETNGSHILYFAPNKQTYTWWHALRRKAGYFREKKGHKPCFVALNTSVSKHIPVSWPILVRKMV